MNGETFLIYTTSQGGYFRGLVDGQGQIRKFTEEEFEALKQTRALEIDTGINFGDVAERTTVRPTLIMLARIEANHDFVLGGPREGGMVP